jgi:hypothetical protein
MNDPLHPPIDPVDYIRACKADPSKWIERKRGFIDWKFSEVAEYLGYDDAHEYCQKMMRWYDYAKKYQGRCLLDVSYHQFLNHQSKLEL